MDIQRRSWDHRKRILFFSNAYIVHDQFSDTNGVLLPAHTIAPVNSVGAAWSLVNGSMDIQSNSVRTLSEVTSLGAWGIVEVGLANRIVACDVTNMQGTFTVGVSFRYVDVDNNWLLLNHGAAAIISLFEVTGGTAVLRASASGVSTNGTHEYKIVPTSSTITVYVDGVSQLVYSSSQHAAATKYGIYGRAIALNPNARHDNFKVF